MTHFKVNDSLKGKHDTFQGQYSFKVKHAVVSASLSIVKNYSLL